MNEGFMKRKAKKKIDNDLRTEYDFASMKGGIRGKYAKRYHTGTNLILIDPELAEAFPTEASVNDTLRAVLRITESVRLPYRAAGQASHTSRRGNTRKSR